MRPVTAWTPDPLSARASAAFDEALLRHQRELRPYLADQLAGLAEAGFCGFQVPLRPRFFSVHELLQLEQLTRVFVEAVARVPDAVWGEDLDALARDLLLPEVLEPWARRHHRLGTRYAFARPDAYIGDGQLQFLEQNIGSGIAGLCFTESLQELYLGLPFLQDLGPVRPLSALDATARYLGGRAGRGVGLVDAIDPETGEPPDREGHELVQRLQARGAPFVYVDARRTELADSGVRVDGQPVDVLFRNAIAEQIWGRRAELGPLLDHVADGRIEMVDNLFEIVAVNKLLLPYLSDPALNGFLSPTERQVLDQVLPWTRRVCDAQSGLLRRQRERFVLKKGRGWSGRAVYLGAELDEGAWDEVLQRAIVESDWIVQERVAPVELELPFLVEDEIVFERVAQMASPYWIGGTLGGFLLRNAVPRGSHLLSIRSGTNPHCGVGSALLIG
jgi:hypothetical protein